MVMSREKGARPAANALNPQSINVAKAGSKEDSEGSEGVVEGKEEGIAALPGHDCFDFFLRKTGRDQGKSTVEGIKSGTKGTRERREKEANLGNRARGEWETVSSRIRVPENRLTRVIGIRRVQGEEFPRTRAFCLEDASQISLTKRCAIVKAARDRCSRSPAQRL